MRTSRIVRLAHGPTRWALVLGLLSAVGCEAGKAPQLGQSAAASEPAPAASVDHSAHASASPGSSAGPSPSPGTPSAPFHADVARLTALGLETVPVEQAAAQRAIRTVGVVGVDETRTSHVHAKVRGVVEGVQADFVGKKVKRGEALCSIFSQQVVAAQLEYLALYRSRGAISAALGDGGALSKDSVMAAARGRLALWDVPPSILAHVEKTGEPVRAFGIGAPRAGTVVARQAYVGAYVEQGTELFIISDLSRLWVQIDLYEADLGAVRVGTPVKLTIEGVGGPLEAPVTFLAPMIDESTRTVRARVEIENGQGAIRPGAFVHAELQAGEGEGLFVPEEAVIRTGKRSVVFVVDGEQVDPREVHLGATSGGKVRVLHGLREGEVVATGAQFLLDAESRLRASRSPGGAHAGH